MSKIKPKRAYAKEILDGFGGIGSDTPLGGNNASNMRNFRILPDGSLQKRNGWKLLLRFSYTVRGYWQGDLNGVAKSFAVSGSGIYRLENGSSVMIGNLPGSSGRVRFFKYREHLYLLDGASLLVYRESSGVFADPVGYAPLYGRNWHPSDRGTVNEPFNLLSNHLRVHYLNSTGSTVFSLPYYADSIDQVRVDGVLTDDYELLSPSNKFSIGEASVGGSVEVAFTVSMLSETRNRLLQCTRAYHEHQEDHEKLALYGSPNGNLLFSAAQVDDNMINASKAIYSDSDPLYFTNDTLLTLGDAEHPITSLYRNHGRVLAFHKAGAYSLSFATDGDTVESYPLLYGMGCTAIDAALYLDGDPVIVNTGGIFRLHSTSGDPDEFTVTCLSEKIAELKTESFAQNALVCEDTAHGELWFCDPTQTMEEKVWVYQPLQKTWVVFDNIFPSFFFHDATDVGFAYKNTLCLFSESLTADNGQPFTAYYQTAHLGFSYPEEVKRALRLTLCASGGGNTIEIVAKTETRSKTISRQSNVSEAPELFDCRVPLGRFRFLQVTVRDTGSARSRIYRLALFANL